MATKRKVYTVTTVNTVEVAKKMSNETTAGHAVPRKIHEWCSPRDVDPQRICEWHSIILHGHKCFSYVVKETADIIPT